MWNSFESTMYNNAIICIFCRSPTAISPPVFVPECKPFVRRAAFVSFRHLKFYLFLNYILDETLHFQIRLNTFVHKKKENEICYVILLVKID